MNSDMITIIKTDLQFPPFSVNSYLIKTKNNRILFDTTIKVQKNIEKILSEIKKLGGIDLIILSHGHLDHAGSAGIISKEFDAPIYVSFEERERVTSGVGERMDRRINKIMKVLDFFGFDKESSEREKEKLSFYKTMMEPIDIFFNINALKDDDIEIINLPGHTVGSVGVYLKDDGIFFSGDGLLFEGISAFFDVERLANTLEEYLFSLDKIKSLNPKKVFPGHSKGFNNVGEVIEGHKRYAENRTKEITELIDQGKSIKEIKEILYPPNQNIIIILAEIIYALEKKGFPILNELKNILV